MTDLKSVDNRPGSALLYLREDELRRGIELLFFGYRDFLSDSDAELATIFPGIGNFDSPKLGFLG